MLPWRRSHEYKLALATHVTFPFDPDMGFPKWVGMVRRSGTLGFWTFWDGILGPVVLGMERGPYDSVLFKGNCIWANSTSDAFLPDLWIFGI